MKLRLFGKNKPGETAKPAQAAGAVSPVTAELEYVAAHGRIAKQARIYARRRVGSLWADDVVQEAFIALWRAYYSKGVLPRETAERVFYIALRRRIAELLERESGRAELEDQHTIDISYRLLPRLDAARDADVAVLEERIEATLATMPTDTASVFRAVRRYDWEIEVAAAELGINYDSARSHFLRAKRLLTGPLAEDGYSIPALKPRGRGGRDGGQQA
jgi:RNA polymerase sigma factor (sigma-70 family)